MAPKSNKMMSMLQLKCPQCHQGDVFVYKNSYNLSKTGLMHKACPTCGLNYQPEPGFYFGASYVSYTITTGIAIAVFAALFPFISWEHFEIYIGAIGLAILVTSPVVFRLSRAIWLGIFFKYRPDAIQKHQKGETYSTQ